MAATAAGVATAAWSRFGAAQPAALGFTDLGVGLACVNGAGANVVALASADGLLLVDGGAEAHAAVLQDALAQRWPGRRVEIAFNTNWRDEHTGANAALRGAGATVMAHENTKLWLGGDFRGARSVPAAARDEWRKRQPSWSRRCCRADRCASGYCRCRSRCASCSREIQTCSRRCSGLRIARLRAIYARTRA